MALIEEGKLLTQLVAAINEAPTAEPIDLVRRMSDQPLAAVPVRSCDGTMRLTPVMLALEPGATPLFIDGTYLLTSPTTSRGVINVPGGLLHYEMPPPGLIEDPDKRSRSLESVTSPPGLLGAEAFRGPLNDAREILTDVLRAAPAHNTSALRRAEEWARPIWERTVHPVRDFLADGGARMWTTGAEGVAAQGVFLFLRREEHRRRFRVCIRCGKSPLYTAPGRRGGVFEVCPDCSSADEARDERSNLKNVLDDVGCPNSIRMAGLVWRNGIRTVKDLRAATGETWLAAAIELAVGRHPFRLVGNLPSVETAVAIILERLKTPLHRGRNGIPGRGPQAFSDLGLSTNPVPSDACILKAVRDFEKKLRKLGNPDEAYLGQLELDALAYARHLRR